MNDAKEQVYARLDEMGIPYRRASHKAAFSIEDCAAVNAQIHAVICKNYFLTTKSKKIHCLCLVRPNAKLKTSDLSRQAGTPRLSFADEASLAELLHTFPGAVTPMGLLFDSENRVRLLVDSALTDMGDLGFHPCDNTETLAMTAKDFFERFLPAVHHVPQFVEIHDFLDDSQI